MTRYTFALSVSLLLNLAMVGTAVFRKSASSDPRNAAGSLQAPAGADSLRKTTGAQVGIPMPPEVEAGNSPLKNEWPSVSDLAAFFGGAPKDVIARLQAAGYPAVRYQSAIATALMDVKFTERIKALPNNRVIPFWDPNFAILASPLGGDIGALREEMSKARAEMLGDAYGPAYGLLMQDDPTWLRRWGFEGLPPEKIPAIWKAFKEVMNGGTPFPKPQASLADVQAMVAVGQELRQNRRAALQALLTPDELLSYDLRASETAGTLRTTLEGIDYSEEQYIAMFRIRQPFDEKWIGVPLNSERSQQKQAEQNQINAQMSAVLGRAIPQTGR